MSVEEKAIQMYEETKRKCEEVRKDLKDSNLGLKPAADHVRYEAKLETLSELLGIPYEYEKVQL